MYNKINKSCNRKLISKDLFNKNVLITKVILLDISIKISKAKFLETRSDALLQQTL